MAASTRGLGIKLLGVWLIVSGLVLMKVASPE